MECVQLRHDLDFIRVKVKEQEVREEENSEKIKTYLSELKAQEEERED